MADCIFCKIVEGKVPSFKIWENEDFLAFLDINPVNPGHTLLIPKKHLDQVFEIREPLYSSLFQAAKKLSKPIQNAMGARRVGIIVEGFLIPHAHIHLIPINGGLELDPGRARKAALEELSKVAMKIREQLKP